MNGMNKRGFTLIELLIVIVIIALLAAILFPVFSSVRQKARQATCASNFKQLSIGLEAYTQDFDDCLPSSNYNTYIYKNGSYTLQYTYWEDVIYPYIKEPAVYDCPGDLSFSSTSTQNRYIPWATRGGANAFGTYQCNESYYNDNPSFVTGPCMAPLGSGNGKLITLSMVQSPAMCVFVAESVAGEHRAAFSVDGGLTLPILVSSTYGETPYIEDGNKTVDSGIYAWHSGLTNVLWCDGHVTTVPLTYLLTPSTTAQAIAYQNGPTHNGAPLYKYLGIQDN